MNTKNDQEELEAIRQQKQALRNIIEDAGLSVRGMGRAIGANERDFRRWCSFGNTRRVPPEIMQKAIGVLNNG